MGRHANKRIQHEVYLTLECAVAPLQSPYVVLSVKSSNAHYIFGIVSYAERQYRVDHALMWRAISWDGTVRKSVDEFL